mgnify:CR=1 FL=1
MTNHITATIEFDYKGNRLSPSAILDLDQLMQQHGTIPPLHQMLAKLNDIDSYSYEYEMMQAEDIQFTNASGWVTNFVQNDYFDKTSFEQYWHEQQLLEQLALELKQQLNIDDIQQHPKLKQIILSAYQLGKKA